MKQMFSDIKVISTDGVHRVPANLDITNVQSGDVEDDHSRLLESIRPDEPTIIFCNKTSRVDKVCQYLRKHNVKNLPYYEDATI